MRKPLVVVTVCAMLVLVAAFVVQRVNKSSQNDQQLIVEQSVESFEKAPTNGRILLGGSVTSDLGLVGQVQLSRAR